MNNLSNNSPSMIELIDEVGTDLSKWLGDHPVIEDEDTARDAKKLIDRGKLGLQDLEAERDGKVRPLNEEVKKINTVFKVPREALERVLHELGRRVTSFLQAEESRRIAAAIAAKNLAEEAERKAREAESLEQDAIRSVDSGVLDIDIKTVVATADDAFRAYEKAAHQAAIAEKDSVVRLGGGFKRALGLRNKKELIIVDAVAAIKSIGATTDIREAILKSARAYRKLHGLLPDGVTEETERGI